MRCKSILVIEDNNDIRESLEQMLRLEGYRVYSVAHGRDGVAAIRRIPGPCLILLDLMMPIMNGWEFLQSQTESSGGELERLPVIVITALGVSSALVHADKDGNTQPMPVVGYVRKPFDMDRLLEMVGEYCERDQVLSAETPGLSAPVTTPITAPVNEQNNDTLSPQEHVS